ncbi:MAG: radical SAM (seleno)protein TrsS [Chloroflexota bacterium]
MSQAVLSTTESVCPECLQRIPARYVQAGQDVYLEKDCPQHGSFRTVSWRGAPEFQSWVRPKTPAYPAHPFTEVRQGCPYDCGLCAEHRQQTCCVLLEVTQRCDLGCPVCFAAAGRTPTHAAGQPAAGQHPPVDPSLERIEAWYRRLIEAGGPYNIQLSGGEPCLRDDLAQVITLGKRAGFNFFQLNTNGLRLAADPAYLEGLARAGLSTVFLQFDGVSDDVYRALRGRPLLEHKLAAIENCLQAGVGVMLVPTVVPGVNDGQIGALVDFALQRMPGVRGVHFQPVSYFGRYPGAPEDAQRITLPEVIREIERQTAGRVPAQAFRPPGGENALCSFHANFVLMPDGSLHALTRHKNSGCCSVEDGALGSTRSRQFVARAWAAPDVGLNLPVLDGPSLGEWDVFLQRARTHTFCLSGMAFQDAWTLDMERLRDCYIHVMSPDGRLVPFCAYNLTGRSGQALYRGVELAA